MNTTESSHLQGTETVKKGEGIETTHGKSFQARKDSGILNSWISKSSVFCFPT